MAKQLASDELPGSLHSTVWPAVRVDGDVGASCGALMDGMGPEKEAPLDLLDARRFDTEEASKAVKRTFYWTPVGTGTVVCMLQLINDFTVVGYYRALGDDDLSESDAEALAWEDALEQVQSYLHFDFATRMNGFLPR